MEDHPLHMSVICSLNEYSLPLLTILLLILTYVPIFFPYLLHNKVWTTSLFKRDYSRVHPSLVLLFSNLGATQDPPRVRSVFQSLRFRDFTPRESNKHLVVSERREDPVLLCCRDIMKDGFYGQDQGTTGTGPEVEGLRGKETLF